MIKFLYVGLGGFFGSVLRYFMGIFLASAFAVSFPFSTFIINSSGSFLIGLLSAFLVNLGLYEQVYKPFLIIGLLGGFTTFSSFSLETLNLIESARLFHAIAYILSSVIVCLIFVYLGKNIGELMR